MLKNDNVDPRLVALLDGLNDTSKRNPKVAARARARFLAEAVSLHDQQRHSLWTIFQQKEKLVMKLIVSTLVIVGVLFGGSATVAAAQNDLPYEPLYRIKLVTEDVNLWFVSDPIAQIDILMQQAQTRTGEMSALAGEGVTPPAALTDYAQERIQRALQLAASLDETSKSAVLQQIRTRLQTQEQQMIQLQDGTCSVCEPVLLQTRDMLRTQLRQIEGGPADPEAFPNQNQNQIQNQVRTTQTPQPTNSIIAPTRTCCTPAPAGTGQQNRNENNDLSAGTPRPQNAPANQGGSGQQNEENNGSGGQNGADQGNGSNQMPGSGGQGGRP